MAKTLSFADLELSAIASAGFHKEHYADDNVQIPPARGVACQTTLCPSGWGDPAGLRLKNLFARALRPP